MKSFTDEKQSKKLAEILPHESADMYYSKYNTIDANTLYGSCDIQYFNIHEYIPCWSLAELLSAIPQEIFDGGYVINITEGCDDKWVLTYDHCENRHHSYFGLSSGADNLVDACYEMILKLHELNLL